MQPLIYEDRCVLLHGDSAQLGTVLPPNSVDSIVSDPPAGVSFMGEDWDGDLGGRDEWIGWLCALMAPAYAALKPGGLGVVWALPRTSHWTATALEDCGFEIADIHHHIFGSGMPHSIDLMRDWDMHTCPLAGRHYDKHMPRASKRREGDHLCAEQPGRKRFAGIRRTSLKPAVEHWILIRKPREGSYIENAIAFGTGGMNVEACRIGDEPIQQHGRTGDNFAGKGFASEEPAGREWEGRWPAHLSLEHADACNLERCVLGCPVLTLDEQSGERRGGNNPKKRAGRGYGSTSQGTEDDGQPHSLQGAASRFFFVAKGSRKEKDRGLDHLPLSTGGEATGRNDGDEGVNNPRAGAGRTGGARNSHPTVKSVGLMQWLVRLVTPAPYYTCKECNAVQAMRRIVCGDEKAAHVLHKDVCQPLYSAAPCSNQGLRNLGERLPADLQTEPSDGEPRGLHHGAPASDGAAPRTLADCLGSGASSQRDQARQPDRKSGAAHQSAARSDTEATTEADRVPSLSPNDQGVWPCQKCGSDLELHQSIVLDPFAGSGTTGVAALAEGLSFVGCELGGEGGKYLPIVEGRLRDALTRFVK